jgi:FtsP/CotA-like multicopper oxidase with cupredoxin domain
VRRLQSKGAAKPRPLGEDLALARRTFLGWCAGVALPGSLLPSLIACAAGESDAAVAPFADIPVLQSPQSAAITVQARKVQWVQGVNPPQANAWVYVAQGATPDAAVLPNHLGPTFNVRRNASCTVTWRNEIPVARSSPRLLESPPIHVPPLLAFCGNVQTQSPVGIVTHLHGARVAAGADGWPLAPLGYEGNPYGFATTREFVYPNRQRGTMLWYHDHAMDRTGTHVHAGLAGLYFIRDEADDAVLRAIGGAQRELPLVIQDRIVATDGASIDYAAGMPTREPADRPEFLGTQLFVNGHPAPELTLSRGTWRLRLLNGSNARTYALALCDPNAAARKSGQVWHSHRMSIIGADGGLLAAPVALQPTDVLLLAPGQRRDVLVDLATLPSGVDSVQWVNLALRALLAQSEEPAEGIYTTFDDTVLAPSSGDYVADDEPIYRLLEAPLGRVLRATLQAEASPSVAQPVDAVLAGAADDDDFRWDGSRLVAPPASAHGPNRLILLMSNTEGHAVDEPVNGISGWSDVQIFEMQAGGDDWQLPFTVDLATVANPSAGSPSTASQGYRLARRSFFAQERNPDIADAGAYPALHAPTIEAKPGSYERWYVANVGNAQPLTTASGEAPDMHPFHVHLVNFVVTARWELDAGNPGRFVPVPPSDLMLDGIARQDTVLIPSNQMVELLVHFPDGYTGDYVYHCHLLEHEDMCMMSHFNVA